MINVHSWLPFLSSSNHFLEGPAFVYLHFQVLQFLGRAWFWMMLFFWVFFGNGSMKIRLHKEHFGFHFGSVYLGHSQNDLKPRGQEHGANRFPFFCDVQGQRLLILLLKMICTWSCLNGTMSTRWGVVVTPFNGFCSNFRVLWFLLLLIQNS